VTTTTRSRSSKAASKRRRRGEPGPAKPAGGDDPGLGRIDPEALPPTGTVYTLEIAAGEYDPRDDSLAAVASWADIEFDGTDGGRLRVQQRRGDQEVCVYMPTVNDWNRNWARLVIKVAAPVGRPPPAEPAEEHAAELPTLAGQGKGERTPAATTMLVPVEKIEVRANSRQDFDAALLVDLGNSMAELGQLQPIVVARRAIDGHLVLVAGERRMRAAKANNDELIEARVYDNLDERTIVRMQLAENFARTDLNHMEIAAALGRLADAGLTVQQIAAEVHKGADWVRRHLGLLELAEPVADQVAAGRIPLKHAELLGRIKDHDQQMGLAAEAMGLDSYASAGEKVPPAKRLEEAAASPGDGLMAVDDLRDSIGYTLKRLGHHLWPMDGGYAGQRACVGCPDNTATEPALFDPAETWGKRDLGICLNTACYKAKQKAWKKDPAYKEQKARQKAERASVRPSSSRPKRDTPFPHSPAERYAVALNEHAVAVLTAIRKHVAKTPDDKLPPDAAPTLMRLAAASTSASGNWTLLSIDVGKIRGKLGEMKQLLDGDGAISWLAGLARPLGEAIRLDIQQPRYAEYAHRVYGVPVSRKAVQWIDCLEALCRRWKIDYPKRPTKADFPAKPKPKAAKKRTKPATSNRKKATK